MKLYGVMIPITGYVYGEFQANNPKEAAELAFDHDWKSADIEEWELHEHVTRGNVSYARLHSIDVTELDDLDD